MQYHIAQTPNGYHIHRIDPIGLRERADALRAEDPELDASNAMAEAVGEVVEGIRTALGFPKRNRWVDRSDWDSSISEGEPHPRLKARIRSAQADGRNPNIRVDGVLVAEEIEPPEPPTEVPQAMTPQSPTMRRT